MSDILNIQGEEIPPIDPELNELLKRGKTEEVRILEGASNRIFGDRKPYAVTTVKIEFNDERNLRNCVRLLRWSDDRLLAMGSNILWSWNKPFRKGMTIRFAVNWYDKKFFERRKNAVRDTRHLSYFRMFGQQASDMQIRTRIL
jgi:hypothetical protein